MLHCQARRPTCRLSRSAGGCRPGRTLSRLRALYEGIDAVVTPEWLSEHLDVRKSQEQQQLHCLDHLATTLHLPARAAVAQPQPDTTNMAGSINGPCHMQQLVS
jgi:hypothetical protein